MISWSNIIESTSYSWKIDVCSKNWKILPVMNFQPMMDLKKNSIEDVFDSSHLEGQYKDSIDLRFIFWIGIRDIVAWQIFLKKCGR